MKNFQSLDFLLDNNPSLAYPKKAGKRGRKKRQYKPNK
jgi:hypothetical protein